MLAEDPTVAEGGDQMATFFLYKSLESTNIPERECVREREEEADHVRGAGRMLPRLCETGKGRKKIDYERGVRGR